MDYLSKLQLFADGAEGADSGTEAPAAWEQDAASRWENAKKGEFKEYYGRDVAAAVQSRLRGQKASMDRYNAIAPIYEEMAAKYGVDPDDFEGVSRAMRADRASLEQEASDKGMSVDALSELKTANAKVAQYERLERERRANETQQRWASEAEEVKAQFPEFNLNAELDNPQFKKLMMQGLPIKAAYTATHSDDIISRALAVGVQAATQKAADAIASGRSRPIEGAAGNGGISNGVIDINNMSAKQMEELIARAQRGEEIVL